MVRVDTLNEKCNDVAKAVNIFVKLVVLLCSQSFQKIEKKPTTIQEVETTGKITDKIATTVILPVEQEIETTGKIDSTVILPVEQEVEITYDYSGDKDLQTNNDALIIYVPNSESYAIILRYIPDIIESAENTAYDSLDIDKLLLNANDENEYAAEYASNYTTAYTTKVIDEFEKCAKKYQMDELDIIYFSSFLRNYAILAVYRDIFCTAYETFKAFIEYNSL